MNKQEFEEKIERTIEEAAAHMEERIDKAMIKVEQKSRWQQTVLINPSTVLRKQKRVNELFFRKSVDSCCTFHRRFCFIALSIHDLGDRLFLRRGIGCSFPLNRSNYFQRLMSIYV